MGYSRNYFKAPTFTSEKVTCQLLTTPLDYTVCFLYQELILAWLLALTT
jgi:hypothetical protein